MVSGETAPQSFHPKPKPKFSPKVYHRILKLDASSNTQSLRKPGFSYAPLRRITHSDSTHFNQIKI